MYSSNEQTYAFISSWIRKRAASRRGEKSGSPDGGGPGVTGCWTGVAKDGRSQWRVAGLGERGSGYEDFVDGRFSFKTGVAVLPDSGESAGLPHCPPTGRQAAAPDGTGKNTWG